ncbi:Shedu anti-phage system protein SduA domain-containing protein [Flavobacterium ginsenosidimutans]|uniref:Shedu anti-phage system protein SduA domain-containing protein n=1 Tax=Flavobacterium ginsenosidimutans TaxID=687844 RepID=UPI003D95C689
MNFSAENVAHNLFFHEISFGGTLRCDFTWLNDNSDGPEWVLVEVEKPIMQLFTKQNEPSKHLHHAIEQVKSWRRYFSENSAEKKRIFGAVAKFRYIIVAGDSQNWSHESAAKWRIDHNKSSEFEIRSSDVFLRSLKILEHKPEELWSFAETPRTLLPSELQQYWEEYGYMDLWRKILL